MDWRRWGVVILFAIAMAWVEAAVVFDLRTLVDRIEPWQPHPLPDMGRLGSAELVRELATLVMLGTVGWLAGRTPAARFGAACVAFGVWDLFYYVFLKWLTGWPRSLLDWDLLFLLPLPWWGPVLAPATIAVLLGVGGFLLVKRAEGGGGRSGWPSRLSIGLAAIGVVVALIAFMADSIAAASGGIDGLRDVLPERFWWSGFIVSLALMLVPVVELARGSARVSARVVAGDGDPTTG